MTQQTRHVQLSVTIVSLHMTLQTGIDNTLNKAQDKDEGKDRNLSKVMGKEPSMDYLCDMIGWRQHNKDNNARVLSVAKGAEIDQRRAG